MTSGYVREELFGAATQLPGVHGLEQLHSEDVLSTALPQQHDMDVVPPPVYLPTSLLCHPV